MLYSELVKQIGAERVRVAHDQVLGSNLSGPFETRHGYCFETNSKRRTDSSRVFAKIRNRQAVRRAEMMIDLEHDLVAIPVALQVAKEGVALIGGGQQREQRPGFGRSKRLDRLTLAVVGDGRRAGNFRALPEPQIRRKEKCLVSPDRPAHIGIEVVAFCNQAWRGSPLAKFLGVPPGTDF